MATVLHPPQQRAKPMKPESDPGKNTAAELPGSAISDIAQKPSVNAVEEPSESSKPADGFPIVGIGASAGGLEAIEAFFEAMPVDSGIAFVVVQHLSPDYKSLMVELLSRKTDIPVQRAEDGMQVGSEQRLSDPSPKRPDNFSPTAVA